MKICTQPNRSGMALMVVMIAIAVLSILVAAFAFAMKVETKLAQNSYSETELLWMGRSGVELARYVLAQQMMVPQEPYDSLNQKWAGGPGTINSTNGPLQDISLTDYPLGKGHFTVKIVDLDRKFNINMADEEVLKRALGLIGADASDVDAITGSILDWIDPDNNTHINGAENDYYQGLTPPYYAKNKPIDDITELLLVANVAPDIYFGGAATNHTPAAFQKNLQRMGLQPDIQSHPVGLVDLFTPLSKGQININTANATQLQMLPYVDEAAAGEIIRFRSGPDGVDGTEDDTPYRNPGELINAIPNNQIVGQIVRFATVRSSTFEVTVDADIAGYKRQFVAIVGRNSPRDLPILSFYWK